jgi:hypothetical protein
MCYCFPYSLRKRKVYQYESTSLLFPQFQMIDMFFLAMAGISTVVVKDHGRQTTSVSVPTTKYIIAKKGSRYDTYLLRVCLEAIRASSLHPQDPANCRGSFLSAANAQYPCSKFYATGPARHRIISGVCKCPRPQSLDAPETLGFARNGPGLHSVRRVPL